MEIQSTSEMTPYCKRSVERVRYVINNLLHLVIVTSLPSSISTISMTVVMITLIKKR